MRTLTSMAILFALALAITACNGSSGEPAATTADAGQGAGEELEITIEDFNFSGAETAAVGDTVTITNEDAVGHTWTAVDGEFDSGTLAEGETFEFTFEGAGEFEYFCSIHPEMEGTITVEG
ncbi:MAG: cupredoxin domain-containing protein [Actinomycetota bacterium]